MRLFYSLCGFWRYLWDILRLFNLFDVSGDYLRLYEVILIVLKTTRIWEDAEILQDSKTVIFKESHHPSLPKTRKTKIPQIKAKISARQRKAKIHVNYLQTWHIKFLLLTFSFSFCQINEKSFEYFFSVYASRYFEAIF
jgi:hypothetical protein